MDEVCTVPFTQNKRVGEPEPEPELANPCCIRDETIVRRVGNSNRGNGTVNCCILRTWIITWGDCLAGMWGDGRVNEMRSRR